jgi:glycerol-3-phosphate dehydrogenase
VAVAPRQSGARTYFVVPWRGRVFAGTMHVPWTEPLATPSPTGEMIGRFIEDLNLAIPGLDLSEADVLRVFAGFMPTLPDSDHEPAHRPHFVAHGDGGGPRGLFTFSGIKWTTAQLEGERVVRRVFPDRSPPPSSDNRPWPWDHARAGGIDLTDLQALPADDKAAAELVSELVADESVVHLDDLLLRRTDWGTIPAEAAAAAERVGGWLGWDSERLSREKPRFLDLVTAAAGPASATAACP